MLLGARSLKLWTKMSSTRRHDSVLGTRVRMQVPKRSSGGDGPACGPQNFQDDPLGVNEGINNAQDQDAILIVAARDSC